MRQRRRRWEKDPAPRRPSDVPGLERDFDADLKWLRAVTEPFEIPMESGTSDRLRRFAHGLLAQSARLNLLSHADAPLVIRKHVAASLGVFLVAQPSARDSWIDVGTGAGFPGLILKIAQPDLRMTLLDAARKRCVFLERMIRELRLGRVPVLPLRAETLVARSEDLGRYDVLTARAVTSLVETVRSFSPLVSPGGRIITFKGPQWGDEVAALELDGPGDMRLEGVTRIPWMAGHILVLRKCTKTLSAAAALPPEPEDNSIPS